MSEHDFTQLVADALKGCKEYNKVDWAQIRYDKITTYSLDEHDIELLLEHNVDVSQYETNAEEVEAHRIKLTEEYKEHLLACDKECCIALKKARIDIGAMKE